MKLIDDLCPAPMWEQEEVVERVRHDDAWDLAGGPQARSFGANQGWLQVLNSQPKDSNAYYLLVRQYIAATLNLYSGADPAIVSPSLDFAYKLFSNPRA
jgi:hypothetical protein